MSATWQCASIRPGMTVAPPSRTTSAPRAAARTVSACPTAAIRPSRISMASAGPAPGAIVTNTASSTISSTMPPGPSVYPPGTGAGPPWSPGRPGAPAASEPQPSAAGHPADVEVREAEELVHDVRHPLHPGHVDRSERVGIERHDRGLHLRQAERRRERLHGPLHGGPARVSGLLALLERGAE